MCCPDKKAAAPQLDRAFVSSSGLHVSYRSTELPIDNTFTLKAITIGESGAGKSKLAQCIQGVPFGEASVSTIGVDLVSFVLEDRDKRYKVQLWDTAGQERFHAIVRSYYRAVQVVLICFALDNAQSMEKVTDWLEEALQEAKGAHIIIVGTKLDVVEADPALRVTTEGFRRSITDHIYIETSAKSGAGLGLLKGFIVKESRRLDKARKQTDIAARQSKTSPTPVRVKAIKK